MNIAVLGGGSWGTALAIHLAKKNHPVRVWEFLAEQAEKMQKERVCPLLPEAKLPYNVFVSAKREEVLPKSELVLLVVPSDKVEATIKSAKQFIDQQPVIICSKGFARDLRLLSEVVEKEVKGEVYCLYGPTHAEEVCQGMFSGIVLAGKKGQERELLKTIVESENLRVEVSPDLIGVQVAAALKNIFAIFVGLVEGMSLGDNTKAYVMTKGLEEIKKVGLKMGAKEETFFGLAGVGDMIVTCTSKHSRNRYLGEQVGKGRKLEEVVKEMKMIAEGVTTLKLAGELEKKLKLKLPLIKGLSGVLFKGKNPQRLLLEI